MDDLHAYLASTSSSSESSDEDDDAKQPVTATRAESGGAQAERPRRKRDRIAIYRALLDRPSDGSGAPDDATKQSAYKADMQEDMVITFETGLREGVEKAVHRYQERKSTESATVWERQLARERLKRSEKRKQRRLESKAAEPAASAPGDGQTNEDAARARAELELLMTGDGLLSGQPERKHFNYDDIVEHETGIRRFPRQKRHRARDEEPAEPQVPREPQVRSTQPSRSAADAPNARPADDADDAFQLNLNDARFAALFESAKYAIDPTDPNFKRTRAMQQILDERRRRRHEHPMSGADDGDDTDRAAVGAAGAVSTQASGRHGNGGAVLAEAAPDAGDTTPLAIRDRSLAHLVASVKSRLAQRRR